MPHLKRIFRVFLILLAVLALSATALAGYYYLQIHSAPSQLITGGQHRGYLLYVPTTYQPGEPAPLVISIHGWAEWPAHQMQISRWNQLAEEEGFLVVYPEGTGFPLRWASSGEGMDGEVQFISDLIDKLASEYNIDPHRIYANGLSNGGGMSFLLSCKLAERIATIGTVSGAHLLAWEECTPARPVPLIAFHGTADEIVPYSGGPSRSFNVPFPNIPAWIFQYAQRNGCAPESTGLPATGEVSGVRYSGCTQDADVIFYTIAGGGHSWPGGQPMPRWIVGHTTQDIDATRVMWQFFLQHPLVK